MKKINLLKTFTFVVVLLCNIPSLFSQIQLPNLEDKDFEKSNIQVILDGEKEVALISKEYVVIDGVGKQMQLLYLPKEDKTVDFSVGYKVKEAGKINFDLTTGLSTFEQITGSWSGNIYITKKGEISYSTVSNAHTTTFKPYFLNDKRGEEIEKYSLVKIGNQIWMRENFRTNLFNDGVAITTNLNKEQWKETKSPAVTYYKSNETNREKMGALYNWFAVKEDRFAPKGWIVPKTADWEKLAKYISPKDAMTYDFDIASLSYTAGELIKSRTEWKVPPYPTGDPILKAGNNLTMLDLKAYGSTSTSKYFDGYSGLGYQGYFWTQTQSDYEPNKGMFIRLFWDSHTINCHFEDKFMGYSVRCIAKDPFILKQKTDNAVNSITEDKTHIFINNSNLKIKIDPALIGKTFKLFTINGQKVLSKKLTSINSSIRIEKIQQGTYVAQFNKSSYKLIIK